MPALATNEPQSRIEQYQGYTKQAADIRAEMTTRLAAAVATDQAKKEAVLPVSLPWVSRQCIASSAKPGWIYTAGADAADYVIVLRNAAGDIVPPAQQVARAAAGDLVLPECGA